MRSALTDTELQDLYTPTPDDLAFLERATKSTAAAFGGLVLLKTFQRLGYFLSFDDVPRRLLRHLATATGVLLPHDCLQQYEQRGFRKRKSIRYNHLVANLVVFYNVVAMTRGLQALVDEGYPVTPEILARLAPYKIGHINSTAPDLHLTACTACCGRTGTPRAIGTENLTFYAVLCRPHACALF
jgi:hypothetical protein